MARSKEDINKDISNLLQEYAEIVNEGRVEGMVQDSDIPLDLRDKVVRNEPVYVVGWVLFGEFETPSLAAEDCTASLSLRREDQARSTSRGLHELGADSYRG